jgi:hypothetical protein
MPAGGAAGGFMEISKALISKPEGQFSRSTVGGMAEFFNR